MLETNVHYPTDANLLFDAARKSIDLLAPLGLRHDVGGWRKHASWKKEIKIARRVFEKAAPGGGANKADRVAATVRIHLDTAAALEEKINATILALRGKELTLAEAVRLQQADYFHTHLIRHMDLVERQVLKVMGPGSETAEAVPNADRLLERFGAGNIRSLSFDKGFSSIGDRELIELYIPEVIMPKKGRKNPTEAERESRPRWKTLRNRHRAVESNINSLEHHGLNRCPDKGLAGYHRYVGFGILACNLHKIGAKLLANRSHERKEPERPLKKAA